MKSLLNEQSIATFKEQIESLSQENHALKEKNDQLRRQVEWFKNQIFGRKSEKRIPPPPPEQLTLGEGFERGGDKPQTITVRGFARGKAPKDRTDAVSEAGLRFDDSVPVREIRLLPVEAKGLSSEQYEVVSEKVNYRLAQQPAGYEVLKYIRPVIKLKDNQALVQAKASPAVIERSQYDVSLIAGMIVDKMLYHQPLHRQHQKLATNGITVSRGSLTQTFHRAAQLLEGIFDAMVRSILLSKVLAIDETPTKAGREGPGKMRQAYFWPIYGDQNEVAFIYCASRATKHVYDILQGYQGIVISDGYAAYQQYCEATQLTHAQCWVHTRRVFFEAQDAEPELCRHALDAIGALYEIEREIKSHGLTDQDKRRYRYERSLPLVERFFQWLKEQQTLQGLTPTNPFLKAAGYAIKREASLKVFLDHPDVPLDTNHIERTLRPITLGRKNWLFSWTEIGAHYIGVTQSLIASCRLHDVNPYDYLVDVLQRIDSHPMSQVDDLLPRNWKMQFADNPLRSDAYYFRTNKPVPIILQ